MIFDGTHADHVEVLPCGAGIAVPAVIGDVDEDVGPLLGEMANLIAKDRFVADEDSVGVTARGEDSLVRAGFEGAYFVEEIFCEEEEIFERDVFAEGHEMHLVVVTDEGAIWVDKGCAVVRSETRLSGGVRLKAGVTCNDRRLRCLGEV